ncbi:hypothetical protein N825_25550 [Skermanella stibiiresistens SB22]|uniref:Uncharacterized protein n=1 Tax=Skermanella stibiiresistens SB22 TaxID=1385369 RepID=W9GSH2_9PROT|nr:hypothetical protein [Skermanella stibiiresistens]EWY36689.1 hypothetical protein N825_25550 [Skermanella stibiiresistens SB22]
MENSRRTEWKQESMWTFAAALILIGGVFAVATVLDQAGVGAKEPVRAAIIHDRSFEAALLRFDQEMARTRPEMFGRFTDGDVRIQSCLGFLTATVRPDRLRFFTDSPNARHYADCLPLRAAHLGKNPRDFIGPEGALGRIVQDRLDPSKLAEILPSWIKPMRRLRDAGVESIDVGRHGVTLRHGGQTATIDVVASADIAGRGLEDLVVRVTGAGAARYAILSQDAAGALVPMAPETVIVRAGLGNPSE